jgi:hypothetical protein
MEKARVNVLALYFEIFVMFHRFISWRFPRLCALKFFLGQIIDSLTTSEVDKVKHTVRWHLVDRILV